jgi:heme exporter protein D
MIVPLKPMILSFLFYAFLVYVLFKLVVNFIIPVYRTTKQVKKSFRDMQDRMQEQHQQQSAAQQHQQPAAKKQQPLGDYIDFEEVKD